MNIYQLLEAILEALADGRQEGESVADYKIRKAGELENRFHDKGEKVEKVRQSLEKKAVKAKGVYKDNPNMETVTDWKDAQSKALDKQLEKSTLDNKEWKAHKIKTNAEHDKNVSEDVNSAIDKKYPEGSAKNKELKDKAAQAQRDADDAAAEHELGKRPEGEKVSGGWDIRDLHIPSETPEQVEYDRKAVDRDIKNLKKQWTKNKVGDYETKNKQFPKSYKDVGVLGEPDKKELETEKVARKALGKRKAKMNKNEALELMEEIINEVSVKRWKEAAANSLDARKEAAQNTAKYAEQSWDTYEEGSRKHPEEEDALYRRAWRDDIIAKKAEEKEDHAHDVLSVKAKGKSANKAIKAARASQDKRDKEYMQNSDPEKFNKLRVRTMKADQLVSADPVKSRADEALEIMEEIISEVSKDTFKNAYKKRQDLYLKDQEEANKNFKEVFNDPKSTEDEVQAAREKKVKVLDDFYKLGAKYDKWGKKYGLERRIGNNEALEIMEEIISEVSDEKAQKALDAARQRYDRENYEASMKLFKGDKKGAEEDGEKSAEKFNKHLNLQLKRAERKGEKLVQDKDDHDYFRISNEAFSLIEQIVDYADNLFELDYEEKQNISPNKISRTKKDKDGEKVEVVSVADELFPYSGSAKEQFNQKVLAKINDMIEGTGSLEDLIQFVRRGVGNKKVAHEGLDEAIAVLEEILNPNEPKKERKSNKQQVYRRMDDPEKGKVGVKKNYNRVIHNDSANKDSAFDYVKIKGTKYRVDKYGEIGAPIREAKDPKGYKENMDIANHYDHLYSKEPANSPDGSPNPVAAEYKRKYQEYFDKAMKCHYGEGKKVSEAKDPVYSNPISRELRGEKAIRDQHSDDMVKYVDRADKATGYRKQVNMERAADAEKAATEASKKFRQHKGEVLDYFRKKGDNNVEAHKKLSRMMGAYEALDVIENIIKEIISEEENWEPAKYKNKWHVYDKASCTYSAVKGGKKGAEKKAKELNTAYPEQKVKVDPFYEALDVIEEIKNVAEGLFKKDERGDLLDDIDTALGSPVKKKLADIKTKMTGCKETKVHEALDLMEEIINEVSVKRWKEAAKNSIEKRQGEEDENNTEHSYFSGRVPKDMQKSLDKEHKERDDKLTDRTERAKYLAKNLPDSNKSANVLKNAAEKVVKSRSAKTDKYRDAEVRNYKKSTSASKTGDETGAAKYMDKAAESSKNRHNTIGREDHARVLANKTLRDSSAKDTKFKEVAGTNAPAVSYKEENKNTRERLEKAEKVYNKADDKKEDMYGKTEKERAAEKLRNALNASNRKFSSHKV